MCYAHSQRIKYMPILPQTTRMDIDCKNIGCLEALGLNPGELQRSFPVPHMIGEVVPLITQPMIGYLQGEVVSSCSSKEGEGCRT